MSSSSPLCDPSLCHSSLSSPVSPRLFCISCVIPFLLHPSCIFHLPRPSSCAPPPFWSLPLYSHSVSHQLFNSAARHFHLNCFPASIQDRSGARGCILSEPHAQGCHGDGAGCPQPIPIPIPIPWARQCVPRPSALLGQRRCPWIPPGEAATGSIARRGAECSPWTFPWDQPPFPGDLLALQGTRHTILCHLCPSIPVGQPRIPPGKGTG